MKPIVYVIMRVDNKGGQKHQKIAKLDKKNVELFNENLYVYYFKKWPLQCEKFCYDQI
jgi:hypothetical protein